MIANLAVGKTRPARLVCLYRTVSYLSAAGVAILQALLNDVGGKLVLAELHHLPLQLLNDVLPASHGSAWSEPRRTQGSWPSPLYMPGKLSGSSQRRGLCTKW